jgi:hypothetical protein
VPLKLQADDMFYERGFAKPQAIDNPLIAQTERKLWAVSGNIFRGLFICMFWMLLESFGSDAERTGVAPVSRRSVR